MSNPNMIEFLKADDAIKQDKLSIKSYIQGDAQTHTHDFFELAYITGGTTGHTLNGFSSTLQKGNYFIVDYGSRHSYEQSKDLTLINCLFLPEIIDTILIGCQSFGDLIHSCLLRYHRLFSMKNSANRIFYDDDGHILHILTVMQKELADKKIGYQEILKNRMLEIIIITMRNIIDHSHGDVKSEMTLSLLDYIHIHYHEHIILNAYSEKTHYSPQYVSRKFKQETGYTVSDYLQKTRIEKSCELLAGSRLSVSEVAEAVGYSDTRFFGALFRKMIRQSPREYRKQAAL